MIKKKNLEKDNNVGSFEISSNMLCLLFLKFK